MNWYRRLILAQMGSAKPFSSLFDEIIKQKEEERRLKLLEKKRLQDLDIQRINELPKRHWDSIDSEIDRQFGDKMQRKRNQLGLLEMDHWKNRRSKPAARNYLTRRQRQDAANPLRTEENTILHPVTPPKAY